MNKYQFIIRAKRVHGDRYNYDKVKYVHSNTKVTITCSLHGDFEQKPPSHLTGRGCPSCGQIARNKASTSNTSEFIIKAERVHGDRYKYDKVKYVSVRNKVTITCNLHGDFEQAPSDHLTGRGCPSCGQEARTSNTSEFITKAKILHKDRYKYAKVKYVSVRNKVTITCNLHGDFEQAPNDHLTGKGCPSCAEIQNRDLVTPSYLYYFRIKNVGHEAKYKIGVTLKKYGIYDRYTKEEYVNFSNLKEWLLPNGKTAYELEQHFLNKYKSDRYYKQILSSGNTELFSCDVLTDEDIAYIDSKCSA